MRSEEGRTKENRSHDVGVMLVSSSTKAADSLELQPARREINAHISHSLGDSGRQRWKSSPSKRMSIYYFQMSLEEDIKIS